MTGDVNTISTLIDFELRRGKIWEHIAVAKSRRGACLNETSGIEKKTRPSIEEEVGMRWIAHPVDEERKRAKKRITLPLEAKKKSQWERNSPGSNIRRKADEKAKEGRKRRRLERGWIGKTMATFISQKGKEEWKGKATTQRVCVCAPRRGGWKESIGVVSSYVCVCVCGGYMEEKRRAKREWKKRRCTAERWIKSIDRACHRSLPVSLPQCV